MRDALVDLKRPSKWRDKSLARAAFSSLFGIFLQNKSVLYPASWDTLLFQTWKYERNRFFKVCHGFRRFFYSYGCKAFQIRGPVTAKAQTPDLERVLGSPLLVPTSFLDICFSSYKDYHTDEWLAYWWSRQMLDRISVIFGYFIKFTTIILIISELHNDTK